MTMRHHDTPATPATNGRAMGGGRAFAAGGAFRVAGAVFKVAVLIDSGAPIRTRYVSH